jgi:transcriptional repressor of dcmA and dcmR
MAVLSGPQTDDLELLDIREAAQFLGVSETSLRRWTNAGVLPCLRIGRRRERRFRRTDLLAFLESQPRHPTRTDGHQAPGLTPRPADQSITLTHGGHLCGFYDSELGRITLAVPFLLEGLQEGSMVYLVASARSIKTVLKYLKAKRPSLDRDIKSGKLLACDYQKDPRAQIKDFESRLDEAAADGSQSFRVFGDTWEMRRKTSADKFADYETSYDQFIARRYPVVTLCAYDARRFSGVDVLDALKAHRDTFRYPIERALA